MGAFIRSKNVLLAELSEGAFIRRGALIRRNTVCILDGHWFSFQLEVQYGCSSLQDKVAIGPYEEI